MQREIRKAKFAEGEATSKLEQQKKIHESHIQQLKTDYEASLDKAKYEYEFQFEEKLLKKLLNSKKELVPQL